MLWRRILLDRNDLSGFLESREQAIHETRSPWCGFDLAFIFVSHICFSRSVRTRRQAGVQLRYPESKRTPFFCQALFLKIFIFGPFFAVPVNSQVLSARRGSRHFPCSGFRKTFLVIRGAGYPSRRNNRRAHVLLHSHLTRAEIGHQLERAVLHFDAKRIHLVGQQVVTPHGRDRDRQSNRGGQQCL